MYNACIDKFCIKINADQLLAYIYLIMSYKVRSQNASKIYIIRFGITDL